MGMMNIFMQLQNVPRTTYIVWKRKKIRQTGRCVEKHFSLFLCKYLLMICIRKMFNDEEHYCEMKELNILEINIELKKQLKKSQSPKIGIFFPQDHFFIII